MKQKYYWIFIITIIHSGSLFGMRRNAQNDSGITIPKKIKLEAESDDNDANQMVLSKSLSPRIKIDYKPSTSALVETFNDEDMRYIVQTLEALLLKQDGSEPKINHDDNDCIMRAVGYNSPPSAIE